MFLYAGFVQFAPLQRDLEIHLFRMMIIQPVKYFSLKTVSSMFSGDTGLAVTSLSDWKHL